MVNDKKEFGKNLRKCRKEAGLTQEALAFDANTTAQTISSYESGSAVPSFNTMIKLAKALKTAPMRLFAYDNEYLTIDDKELQYILVEKFKEVPFAKRNLIYKLIDVVISENSEN